MTENGRVDILIQELQNSKKSVESLRDEIKDIFGKLHKIDNKLSDKLVDVRDSREETLDKFENKVDCKIERKYTELQSQIKENSSAINKLIDNYNNLNKKIAKVLFVGSGIGLILGTTVGILLDKLI